jgi:hypothetical protein
MSLTCKIHDLLAARASSGRDAYEISETTFEKVNAMLRQRFGVTYSQAELLLIDVAREHEQTLYVALRNRLNLDDVEDAIRLCLRDDE